MVPLADFVNHENIDVTYEYILPDKTIVNRKENSDHSSGCSSEDEV